MVGVLAEVPEETADPESYARTCRRRDRTLHYWYGRGGLRGPRNGPLRRRQAGGAGRTEWIFGAAFRRD